MQFDFFRKAEWLDKNRALGYLHLLALLHVLMLALLLLTSRNGVDLNGLLIGTDFISFWTSGRMLSAGANVYDIAAHTAAQREFYSMPEQFTGFFYPPGLLPIVWPLGTLPYFAALAVWIVLTGIGWLSALQAWFSKLGLNPPTFIVIAAFPPIIVTITHGQTAFLVGALLGGGLLMVREKPWLAGALLGLATIKPQFGLLVPIALLAGGRWCAIVAAAASALGLAGLATWQFGPQVWSEWFSVMAVASRATDDGAIGFGKMVSLFAGLRLLGVSTNIALSAQIALTLAICICIAFTAWRRPFSPGLAALVLAGTPLTTPFILDYDLTLTAFPLVYLFSLATPKAFLGWERIGIAALFVSVDFARPTAMYLGVPLMPFLLIALFLLVLRRAHAEAVPCPPRPW